jgi:hypothetical protein
MSGGLEQRYRRLLRLLPGWYRVQWEQDMVAAFLDSRLTGDPALDEHLSSAARPSGPEVASVAVLAVRLHLAGRATPRRHAWGQSLRRAVFAVVLVHAVLAVNVLAFLWSRRLVGWLPAPPGSLVTAAPGGAWDLAYFLVSAAWIVIFVTLASGHYPVLAMIAFRGDARPGARGLWLLALPAGYLLVYGALWALLATGSSAWLPDFPGLCCVLVGLACLAHAPLAWSRRAAGTGPWSLAMVLLAVIAGAYRIISLAGYLNEPHLIRVSLAELLILLTAAALVAPDAARAQAAAPGPPPHPKVIAA